MRDGATTDKLIDGTKVAIGAADILQSISGLLLKEKITLLQLVEQ